MPTAPSAPARGPRTPIVPAQRRSPEPPRTPPPGPPPGRVRLHRSLARPGRVVLVVALLGLLAGRLPFLDAPLGKDEAGYLVVGGQWRPGGTSLYGDLWVDRPPLLVTLFRLADLAGGAVPLRLLGLLACVVTVLAVVDAVAHLAVGRSPWRGPDVPTPAAWAAPATVALLVSPLTGSTEVNGELLAAPLVAVAVAATARALLAPAARRVWAGGLVAGAAAVAAVLVKQNLVDGLLLSGALVVLAVPVVGAGRAARVLGAAGLGGLLVLGATAAWTLLHGTSLGGVWWASYPFRLLARDLLLSRPGVLAAQRREVLLAATRADGVAVLLGLVALLLGATALDAAPRHRRTGRARGGPLPPLRGAAVVAVALTAAWGVVSIDLGGGWWLHYQVQLVVPLGLGVGLVTARWPRAGALAAGGAAVSALAALVALGPVAMPPGGAPTGEALRAVARPGDTVVTVLGNADVTRASGLRPAYPYLWLLPTATLDPHLRLLSQTLAGPRAPTWFVDLGSTRPQLGQAGADVRAALRAHYHRVATLEGGGVWLRDGVRRATPRLPSG